MASLKLFVLAVVFIAAVAAQSGYKAPEYAAPRDYVAPAYGGADYKPANGRVKIQVYRGPNKEYGKGYEKGYDNYGAFAPWGFYVTQPEDYKGYGY